MIGAAPRRAAPLDAVEPDPSGSDNEHARAPLGAIDDGAEAGDDTAAEEHGDIEADRRRDDRDLRLVDDDRLGERGRVQPLGNMLASDGPKPAAEIGRTLVLA